MSLENLTAGNKLPVLFIGSGFSRRYLNAPDWQTLLIKVYMFMGKSENDFKKLSLKIRNKPENKDISNGEANGLIAEEIENEFNEWFYSEQLSEEFDTWLDEDINPFRRCVAFMLEGLSIPKEMTEEIKAFKELKNKIMSIVTTNYDGLIESLFSLPEESVFVGQPQLFNPDSMELGELYKIHGSITHSKDIIITRSDYNNFKETAKLFSAKLLTLITENPVIFIGYSVDDPNIQQTLTDLVNCLSHKQLEQLKDHFYLIEHDKGREDLLEREYLFKAISYDKHQTVFPITVISTDNYLKVYKQLSNLTPAMNISTVKRVKRILKDIIVDSVETKEKADISTILIDDVSKLNDDDQKFAVAIGDVKEIHQTYGYNLRPIEDILEDVLFNNKGIDSERIVKETYEGSYLKVKRILPIHKYLKDVSKEILDECPRVKEYVDKRNAKNDYLNKNLINSLDHVTEGTSINDMPQAYKEHYRKKYLYVIKNIDNLDLDEVKKFLQEEYKHYVTYNPNHQSDLRRLISLYDFYKYS
ncbi:SIR2 family protein [Salibacterium halotolerans]|uniref:SIR2-like domain-containing protein n=1 Tax=Salibacterium halotolerans TaxID=1884432 RepID=A0A1I5Y3Q2_9BACI|nr:SIR2 family protein [Salibacterium halotolerans]SFQ38816.1 SIR2-like domain-containing protein [Salibacterium halotolerans]